MATLIYSLAHSPPIFYPKVDKHMAVRLTKISIEYSPGSALSLYGIGNG